MTAVPRVLPCLLLDRTGQLVKTVRFDDPLYVGDPVNVLSIFSHYEVDEIALLDIHATLDGRDPPYDLLAKLASECMIPLAYGGGIRSLDQARRVIETGLEKVIVNTALAEDPEILRRVGELYGNQAVVASIDAAKVDGRWEARVRGGRVPTGVDVVEWAERAEEYGCGEILLTSVDREGTFDGYDLELIRTVAEAVSVPVIANGGAGHRTDLVQAVREGHASAAAAASIFVFQSRRRSVLVNFPSRRQVKSLFA